MEVDIIATHTGPDGGLTTVNRGQRGHVTSQDPDVSFIDSEEDSPSSQTTAATTTHSTSSCKLCFVFLAKQDVYYRLEGLLETLPTR